MKRILIISDDFNELTFLETLLKKIGFDALGIQNSSQALEQSMIMNPDMLIIADTLRGQSTHIILENLMSFRPQMLVLLLKKDLRTQTGHVPEFINKTVKSPVDPLDLIRSICQVAKLKEDQFIEKYSKLGLFKGEVTLDSIKVTGKAGTENSTENKFVRNASSAVANEKMQVVRGNRFQDALLKMDKPLAESFNHKEAIKEVQEFRARSKDAEIIRIDEQRKNFVRALFKKA